MLSYRHAFHAGNYADVLKHLVLVQVLQYLTQKDKPLCYIDTHAGSGLYKINSKEAQKTGEYQHGIAPLWALRQGPKALMQYLDCVREVNRTEELKMYPGSGLFATQLLRPQDRLFMCELHSTDFPLLQRTFASFHNAQCFEEDGFQKSIALLPPIERRGVLLIDPSYEIKSDYQKVVEHLQQCYRRFATGVYLLWYPLVEVKRIETLCKNLQRSGVKRVHRFELGITTDHDQPGMTATGMIVVNPTFGLVEAVESCLPILSAQLGDDSYWKSEILTGE